MRGIFKRGSNWVTFLRTTEYLLKVTSPSEREAQIKYNILVGMYRGRRRKPYDLEISDSEWVENTDSLMRQLLNTRDENIRTSLQGLKKRESESGYVGVYKNKRAKSYYAYIRKNGKRYSLGYYKKDVEAATAYNIAALILYGERAKLNNNVICDTASAVEIKVLVILRNYGVVIN